MIVGREEAKSPPKKKLYPEPNWTGTRSLLAQSAPRSNYESEERQPTLPTYNRQRLHLRDRDRGKCSGISVFYLDNVFLGYHVFDFELS